MRLKAVLVIRRCPDYRRRSVICTTGAAVTNFRQVADTLEFGMQAQVRMSCTIGRRCQWAAHSIDCLTNLATHRHVSCVCLC
jgi:hypothetical protein